MFVWVLTLNKFELMKYSNETIKSADLFGEYNFANINFRKNHTIKKADNNTFLTEEKKEKDWVVWYNGGGGILSKNFFIVEHMDDVYIHFVWIVFYSCMQKSRKVLVYKC